MSGRPYTMKEMKSIVEYLTENKYYTEIKGRKMWMNYANTSLTIRTWQSLKETFLKRILPDIYNPYYKLTKEQIVSFKQGYDVEAKDRNKLEIQTISDDSSSDGQENKDKQPTTSNNNAQETTDEGNKCSKISSQNRSSTDTVVLETCYENAEEIQKVLESSPSPNIIEKKQKKTIKKFKDFITYSEPLAPILQEVINDFASESESSDREPVMEIDLNPPDSLNEENINIKQKATLNQGKNKEDVIPHVAKTTDEVITNVIDEVPLNENQKCEVQPIEKLITSSAEKEDLNKVLPVNGVDKTSEELIKGREQTDNNHPSDIIVNSNIEPRNKDDSAMINKKNVSQNCSNTTDSLLPNNPEGFEMNKITNIENTIDLDNTKDIVNSLEIRPIRKRATSEDNLLLDNKKKRISTKMKGKLNLSMKKTKTIIENPVEYIVENSEEIKADVIESNFNKPTTSKSFIKKKNDETDLGPPLDKKCDGNSPQMKNLCLKSVSLFEEQFNNNKYTDSESSGVFLKTKRVEPKTKDINIHKKVSNDNVILLKSNSESERNEAQEVKRSGHTAKSQREEALANIFGFSSGAVTSKRKTKRDHKRSISRHKIINSMDSDSSEWTSQTDSDAYVSPPRGRRHRHTKKYLKPKSLRIQSLEEEGGLFVMYGKRIYPIVKDGKIVKNYLTYTPDNDCDLEDEDFWKLKYEEEKKKTEELEKISAELKKKSDELKNKKTTNNLQPQEATTPVAVNKNVRQEGNGAQTETRTDDTIKIKFSRNNEEVHLEGNWPQINTVLEQVVNIFHKEYPPKVEEPMPGPPFDLQKPQEMSSGKSTPVIVTVDPEVRKKVDNIEKEIFQEIAERDKEEQTKPDEESNVTKRPRRSRRISSMSLQSAAKRSKSSNKNEPTNTDETKAKTEKTPEKPVDTTYVIQTRTRSKTNDASFKLADSNSIQTRKSPTSKEQESKKVDDDEKIRYMLPPVKRGSSNKHVNSKNIQKSSESLNKPADITSPDSLSRISESTQGYHESDNSPIRLKKRKKLSTIVRRTKRRRSHVLRSQHNLILNHPYDTSNSLQSLSKINNTKQHSSANYNSESYQYLFPHRAQSSNMLERIDEIYTIEKNIKARRFEAVSNEEYINKKSNANDVGSSSNVSLPLSPELSLVENMSLSKDLLNSINERHTMNQINGINNIDKHSQFKYSISGMDITLPLMQQMCAIDTDRSPNRNTKSAITESLIKEIRSVKIYDNSSDSIDRKLQELLLESTRKDKVQNMEVDINIESNTKKSGTIKRCSTPLKKKGFKKSKNANVDTIIEENMECCSLVGASSCPPSIQVFDENAMDYEEVNANNNGKRKQKKDIIRVKILKPKSNKSKDNCEKVVRNDIRMSVCTDSGINDTKMIVFPQDADNSVELIHNHSETCLRANECIGDSVELIENNRTVVSLNSDSVRSDDGQDFNLDDFLRVENDTKLIDNNNVPNFEVFNNQLKSKSNIKNGIEMMCKSQNDGDDNSSLVTEDLSDELPTQTNLPIKQTKWFLFSEDEMSNTNPVRHQVTGAGSGANLKQIFPITCAIPELSDITEASKENDDARKSNADVDLLSAFNIDWN